MPATFFGRSGGGGGGSDSPFFGIAYGPVSLLGPPASGGTSCWLGFCWAPEFWPFVGCSEVSCAAEGMADPVTRLTVSKKLSRYAQKCAPAADFWMQLIENIRPLVETPMLV